MWQGERDDEHGDDLLQEGCKGDVATAVRECLRGDDHGDGRATQVRRASHADQAVHAASCPIATHASRPANATAGYRSRRPTVRSAAGRYASGRGSRGAVNENLHVRRGGAEEARTGPGSRQVPPITFRVEGNPVPQPRPRVSTTGCFGWAHVPTSRPVHGFRSRVGHAARDAGLNPADGPVSVQIVAPFGWPRSHLNKSGVKPSAPVLSRPDCDNLATAVLDGLQDMVGDDTKVVSTVIEKRWGYPCSTTVTVTTSHDDGGPHK